MSAEKPQPIGWMMYLKITIPFALAGFLLGAWICRSPAALVSFQDWLRANGIANFTPPPTPAEFNEAWWVYVGVGTVLGMFIGETVRPFIRKGPIF